MQCARARQGTELEPGQQVTWQAGFSSLVASRHAHTPIALRLAAAQRPPNVPQPTAASNSDTRHAAGG